MIEGKQVFDCFTFFNERELLELRFMEYYDVVDYFVLVEATKTHTGKPHTPIFESLKPEFKKYLDKVIHIVVDDLPQYSDDNIWIAENFQRNAIERGLKDVAKEGDAIFVSDLDEFWNTDKLKHCIGKNYPIVFEQDLFYYWVNCKQNCKWIGTCYAPYGLMTPQEMRDYARFNQKFEKVIKNGGWHYSYMGGAQRIKEKVENIAESREIIALVGNIEDIETKMANVNDLWNRTNKEAQKSIVVLNKYQPKMLCKFIEKYPHFIHKNYKNKFIKNDVNKIKINLFGIKISISKKQKNELKKIEVHLAEHCNLNCQNCDHFSPLAEEKFLDIKQYEKDLKQLSKLTHKKLGEIDLLGGEPLLNKDINQIMYLTRKHLPNTKISIITNGILLLEMDESFWNSVVKNNVSIIVTKYPIKLDYDKMMHFCKEKKVDFSFFGDTDFVVKTSNLIPLDTEGKQNCNDSYANCYHANKCIFLKNGRLYTCPVAPNIEHFNKYFNKNLPDVDNNSINIHKARSIKEILKFLSKPIPLCAYCDVGHRCSGFPWKTSTKNMEEWTYNV